MSMSCMEYEHVIPQLYWKDRELTKKNEKDFSNSGKLEKNLVLLYT